MEKLNKAIEKAKRHLIRAIYKEVRRLGFKFTTCRKEERGWILKALETRGHVIIDDLYCYLYIDGKACLSWSRYPEITAFRGEVKATFHQKKINRK